MNTPLRYMYNPAFFEQLCSVLSDSIPDFDDRDFIFRVFNNAWPDMDLKQRSSHIASVLHHFLDRDFALAAKQVIRISNGLRKHEFPHHGLENIFLAEYIDLFGGDHSDLTVTVRTELAKTIGAETTNSSSVI